jgi:hypothetical protein
MTREERCKLAIEKGYTYDSETGLIKNRHGKVLTRKTHGYIFLAVAIDKKRYNIRAHQFSWYYVHGYCAQEIDHMNGIRDDNRLCNLRAVTRQQNNWNRIKAKGYTYNKLAKKYQAKIRLNSKSIFLGYYNTPEQARKAYLQAKEKYHKI